MNRTIIIILTLIPICLFSITKEDILSEITNMTSLEDFNVISPIGTTAFGLGSKFDNSFDLDGLTFKIDSEYNRIYSISIEREDIELNRGIKLGDDLFSITSSRNDAYELFFNDKGQIGGVKYRLKANPYEEFTQTFYVDTNNKVNKIDLNVISPRYINNTIDKVLDIKPLREIDFILFDTNGNQLKWNNNFKITNVEQYTYRGIRLGSLDVTIKGMYRDSDAVIESLSEDSYTISYSYADDDNVLTLKYSLTNNRVTDIELIKTIL